jgi:aspartyl-tRNA(Asn)/glutamyl-tRNA(Gln) amidotransferase subunit C
MVDYWKIDKKVSKLELTDEEKEKYMKQLADILGVFKEIDEVDTEGVEPSFHPIEIKNVWREDEVKRTEWDPLGNTEYKEKKYFKGPRVV